MSFFAIRPEFIRYSRDFRVEYLAALHSWCVWDLAGTEGIHYTVMIPREVEELESEDYLDYHAARAVEAFDRLIAEREQPGAFPSLPWPLRPAQNSLDSSEDLAYEVWGDEWD